MATLSKEESRVLHVIFDLSLETIKRYPGKYNVSDYLAAEGVIKDLRLKLFKQITIRD